MVAEITEKHREVTFVEVRDITESLTAALDAEAVVELPVRVLKLDWSVRLGGASEEHLQILAHVEEELPPIVVQHPSMTVIDGIHRVRVAMMCGQLTIPARLFRGPDGDAFVLAVRLNTAHGLALTRDERNAAAEKIIYSHRHWSNRMIAKVTGLSAGTVASIRKRSTAQVHQSNTRIGLDGRARPVNGDASRERVTELLAKKPEASIRAIAQEAGVSVSTVHHCRKRMTMVKGPAQVSPLTARSSKVDARSEEAFDINDTVGVLAKDPSIRLTETGRKMIRLLNRSAIDFTVYGALVDRIPEHCVVTAAKLARQFSQRWALVAEGLEQRYRRQTS